MPANTYRFHVIVIRTCIWNRDIKSTRINHAKRSFIPTFRKIHVIRRDQSFCKIQIIRRNQICERPSSPPNTRRDRSELANGTAGTSTKTSPGTHTHAHTQDILVVAARKRIIHNHHHVLGRYTSYRYTHPCPPGNNPTTTTTRNRWLPHQLPQQGTNKRSQKWGNSLSFWGTRKSISLLFSSCALHTTNSNTWCFCLFLQWTLWY